MNTLDLFLIRVSISHLLTLLHKTLGFLNNNSYSLVTESHCSIHIMHLIKCRKYLYVNNSYMKYLGMSSVRQTDS